MEDDEFGDRMKKMGDCEKYLGSCRMILLSRLKTKCRKISMKPRHFENICLFWVQKPFLGIFLRVMRRV